MAQEPQYNFEGIPTEEFNFEGIPSIPTPVPVRATGAGPRGRQEGMGKPLPPKPVNPNAELAAEALRLSEHPELDLLSPIMRAPRFLREGATKIAQRLTTPVSRQVSPLDVMSGRISPTTKNIPTDPITEASPVSAFVGGALEGASELASPANLALTAVGGGEIVALNRARKLLALGKLNEAAQAARTARNLERITRVASVPVGVSAGTRLVDPESTGMERLTAVPELAGSMLGMRSRVRPAIEQMRVPNLAEQGTAGPDIPLRQLETGTFAPEDLDLNAPITPRAPTAISKPLPFQPPSITIKPGPTQLQNIVRMTEAGYRVTGSDEKGVRMVPTDHPVPESMPVIQPDLTPVGQEPDILAERQQKPIRSANLVEPQDPEFPVDYFGEERRTGVRKGIQFRGQEITPDQPIDAMSDIPGATKAMMEEDPTLFNRAQAMADRAREVGRQNKPPRLSKLSETTGEDVSFAREPDEILPPEEELDIFGIPKSRDLTPEEVEQIKRSILINERQYYGEDVAEYNQMVDEQTGTMEGEIIRKTDEPQMMANRSVDESGQPIQTQEFTPEQLEVRRKQIATDWYKARLQARSLGIDDRKYRHLNDLREAVRSAGAEPTFSMIPGDVEQGGMDIGNPREMIEVFLNTYRKDVATVATKELIQNALDATKGMGSKGEIKINIDEKQNSVSVEDNGPGLLPEEFKELYLKLSASGKRGKGLNTIGELGVGKVSYLLGGQQVEVTSVAFDPATGKKIKTRLVATKEELLSKTADIEVTETEEPTGITTKVLLKPKSDPHEASKFVEKLIKYSSFEANIFVNKQTRYSGEKKEHFPPKPFKPLKLLHSGEVAGSTKYKISIPQNAEVVEADSIPLVLTNRGMFQGVDGIYVYGAKNIPSELVIELDPTVTGLSDEYPLTAPVRESLKDDVKHEIRRWINDNIIKKGVQDRVDELKRIYASMLSDTINNSDYILYDGGGRYTPDEIKNIKLSKDLQILGNNVRTVLTQLLRVAPSQKALGALTKNGFVFEDKVGGVNLKDPTKDNAFAILLNPFELAYDRDAGQIASPQDFARGIVHTTIHEFTHLGERNEGAAFTWFLGQMYAKYPLEQQLEAQRRILSGITGIDGRYTPEFQKLLSEYFDSRGRSSTTKDSLLGERGINSFTESIGPQAIRTGPTNTGGGTPTIKRVALKYESAPKKEQKKLIEAAIASGYVNTGFRDAAGNPIWEKPKEEPINRLAEAWNLPRGAMSVDLPFLTSAGLRQGATAIFLDPNAWMRAWYNASRAYSSKVAYNMVMDEISKNKYFQRGPRDPKTGKETPSFAELVKLPLTDVTSLSNREEVIKSRWAEKFLTYKGKGYGQHVAASNRAYTAFLNTVRAGALVKFADQGKLDAAATGDESLDLTKNLELAKEVVEAIGTLTGRGPAEVELTPLTGRTKQRKLSAEKHVEALANIFFSPRLQASRMKMLNPNTYISASSQVRKMYVKGMMSLLSVWGTIGALAVISGVGDVELDPSSADFGKIRIGNTRFDPGAGFQQFLVLMYRRMSGEFTTSTTGTTREMRRGFRPITPGEVTQNFISSKLHPSAKFIYDEEFATEDKPFFVGDRILQLFAPMFSADLNEIIEEDPTIIPPVLLGSGTGLGVQTYDASEPKPAVTPFLENMTGIPFTEYDVRIPPIE